MTSSPGRPLPTLKQVLSRVHMRLILCAVLMAGVTLTVTGVLIMRGYAQRNLALIAETVGYTVEPAILFQDLPAMREGVARVAGSDSVHTVEIRDPKGQVILNWTRPDSSVVAKVERAVGDILWPIPATVPVLHGRTMIAQVHVFGAAGGIGRYILSSLLTAIVGLGLTILAARLLAHRLQRDVTEPLARIAEVAHAVRSDREFNRRAPTADILEVDELATDFNALLDELQAWHDGMVTENRLLAQQATRDALTGLSNRVMFERQLAAAIERSDAESTGFAVVYVDVNRFKQVNDTHGHDAGDVMLIVIAARLRVALRPGDMAFRLGGDEFALILAPGTTRPQIDGLTSHIANSMEQPIMLPSGESIASSLSLGSALYPDDSADARDLMRQADAAMYAAKTGAKR